MKITGNSHVTSPLEAESNELVYASSHIQILLPKEWNCLNLVGASHLNKCLQNHLLFTCPQASLI